MEWDNNRMAKIERGIKGFEIGTCGLNELPIASNALCIISSTDPNMNTLLNIY